jgi:hypothetical protein
VIPFREEGIRSVLQIEDMENEFNPYYHSPEDSIAHMNLDYWTEQIKATVAIIAHLAVPVTVEGGTFCYLPMVMKAYQD